MPHGSALTGLTCLLLAMLYSLCELQAVTSSVCCFTLTQPTAVLPSHLVDVEAFLATQFGNGSPLPFGVALATSEGECRS
jgi:hypothetical protein